MGSDLYMEQRDFRPRPNKAVWELVDDKMQLVIYRDTLMGWAHIWNGVPNEHKTDLIKLMVREIPEKPQGPHTLDEALSKILIRVQSSRRMQDDDCEDFIGLIKDAFERFGYVNKS